MLAQPSDSSYRAAITQFNDFAKAAIKRLSSKKICQHYEIVDYTKLLTESLLIVLEQQNSLQNKTRDYIENCRRIDEQCTTAQTDKPSSRTEFV